MCRPRPLAQRQGRSNGPWNRLLWALWAPVSSQVVVACSSGGRACPAGEILPQPFRPHAGGTAVCVRTYYRDCLPGRLGRRVNACNKGDDCYTLHAAEPEDRQTLRGVAVPGSGRRDDSRGCRMNEFVMEVSQPITLPVSGPRLFGTAPETFPAPTPSGRAVSRLKPQLEHWVVPHASAACTALAVASTPRMSRPPISLVVNRFLPSSNPLRAYQARFQSHPSA